jgi:hypothetical protein
VPEQLPDRNFLTITNIRCWKGVSPTDVSFEGNLQQFTKEDLQKGVKIFYNRPVTVSCNFAKDKLAGASSVQFSVEYEFEENAKLITYFMKDYLLEDLLIKGENPLDFMDIPSGSRRPSTIYDNGPAKIGMGPIELLNPPMGVETEAEKDVLYPNFELVIGNQADFSGTISKVKSITITMPEGVSLIEDETCYFESAGAENVFVIKQSAIEDERLQFENIASSRLYTCGMSIDAEKVLRGSSFSQVEFEVDIDFIYEAKKSISTKSSR